MNAPASAFLRPNPSHTVHVRRSIELTTGMYTREEVLDNDFSDDFGEDIQIKVQKEIKKNENSQEFTVEDEAVVAESEAVEVETPEFAKE